jgi:signal transduction histidine kinase
LRRRADRRYRHVVPRSALPTALAVALSLASACAREPGSGAIEVRTARAVQSTAPAPPGAELAGAPTVELPDVWRAKRREASPGGWYRTVLRLEGAPDQPWGVYLPRIGTNAAVWVNGVWIGDGGRLEPPVARNWNRPLLFPIPVGLLRAGENDVDVRLAVEVISTGMIAPFWIGPLSVLEPAYATRSFAQVTGVEWGVVLMVGIGALVAVIFFRRPDLTLFGWFAAATFLWAFGSTELFLRDPPLPLRVWQWLVMMALIGTPVCFAFQVHRFFEIDRPRVERAFAFLVAAVALAIPFVPMTSFEFARGAVIALALVPGVYVMALLVRGSRREGPLRLRLLYLPALIALGFAVHDLLLLAGLRPAPAFLLGPYLAPAVALWGGWALVDRFANVLGEVESLNRDLERRVAEKHAELEDNYRRMRRLETEQAVQEERERIMRDVHEGLGGQLMSLLATIESRVFEPELLADAVRDALDDLRILVLSRDDEDDDLLARLSVVRSRLEPRLRRAGLRFDWQIEDVPALAGRHPALHVQRVVHEAIVNAIRHADASTVTVRTGTEIRGGRNGIVVEVRDDGRGIAAGQAPGRGIGNMRRRAAALGGDLLIAGSGGGTRVDLWIPLGGTTPEAPSGAALRPDGGEAHERPGGSA